MFTTLPVAPATGTVLPKSDILTDFQIATMEQADENWASDDAGLIWQQAWPFVQGNQSFKLTIEGGIFGNTTSWGVLGTAQTPTPAPWDLSAAQAFVLWRHVWRGGSRGEEYQMWLRFHSTTTSYAGSTPDNQVGTDVYSILLEKGTDASYSEDADVLPHSARYFFANKSDFTITGSPTWANIVEIEIRLFEFKVIRAETVFDDLQAVKVWEPTAGGSDPSGTLGRPTTDWTGSGAAGSGWSPVPPGQQT